MKQLFDNEQKKKQKIYFLILCEEKLMIKRFWRGIEFKKGPQKAGLEGENLYLSVHILISTGFISKNNTRKHTSFNYKFQIQTNMA